ncbi:Delta-60 repeat domain-containing protein [Candidatus Nitrotoga sp. BS]|uniref:hypothetical protein n=1 Tax=Candidatus Nitrotoga sp. BS TaxID=2890408 RepID=UPI001EF16DF0|nr:hypothetical protein [Candidatus Nitrotoga sp. BS]CAH1194974.1 Delta-60 repeat domain-containing protein [Candidatus Nitrotoga sp. BS]
MSNLLKVLETVKTKKIFAILFTFIALHATMFEAHAAPVLDSSFGSSGIVRIGVPAGAEDRPTASALQRDGKLLLAGWTAGRQSHAFVLRLLPNGTPDATFGQNGVALFDLPNGDYYEVLQLEQGADGSILINGSNWSGFVLTRLTAAGVLDTSFGTQGFFSVEGTPARFVQQPDGGLLIVSDATQGSQFALRLTRLNPAGVRDSTYAPNGEKILSGLPPNFRMASGVSVVAEPDGEFTVMARATFIGGTYLLVRVTAAGTLNFGFGNGGLISWYDVYNATDHPVAMVRTAIGGLLLMGNAPPPLASGKIVLWRITPGGLADASFGTAGRLEIDNGGAASHGFRLAALSDGSIALLNAVNDTTARVSHFDASGVLDSAFGVAGSATIAFSGYITTYFVDILSNGVGGLLIPATANLAFRCSSFCVPRGADAAVASLDSSGRLQTSYGQGNGFAVMNTAEYSNDRIDSILVETSGKVVLAGYSDTAANFDYLLERLTANGSPDISFGTNGRVAPKQYTHFMGKVRTVEQESGAITVVTGTAQGSRGQFGSVTAFRIDSAGMLDAGFAPALSAPSSANTDIALGVRPDGRLLYGTTPDGTAILQQTMPDGTPDVNFGASGKIEFPLSAEELSRHADLVLLGDGSVVFAVLTNQNLRLYKVDSHGLPVASFGTDGQFAYAFADGHYPPFSLLSLSDGSLLAGIPYALSSSLSGSLYVIRISNNGMLIGENNLLADPGSFTWNFSALPNASVVIARSRYGATNSAALYRLLPNNSLDASFGISGAFPLPGMESVSALALDANSRLLVAGQDATSAVLARYDLSGALASVPIVEFYNTNLDHYFITADASEAAGIDGGSAGPGWIRTGGSFKSGGSTPVCRFYGSQVPGPNSHFYTLASPECDGLKQLQAITPATQKRWNFESLEFISSPPTDGTCPAGTTPVYRAYNNGFARGIDSNHRLSSSAAAIQEVVTRGWIDEGVVMCAPI